MVLDTRKAVLVVARLVEAPFVLIVNTVFSCLTLDVVWGGGVKAQFNDAPARIAAAAMQRLLRLLLVLLLFLYVMIESIDLLLY